MSDGGVREIVAADAQDTVSAAPANEARLSALSAVIIPPTSRAVYPRTSLFAPGNLSIKLPSAQYPPSLDTPRQPPGKRWVRSPSNRYGSPGWDPLNLPRSRMGPIYSPPPPGSFLSGSAPARTQRRLNLFALRHDACGAFERAADPLHRARINTELLGNDAHTWPSRSRQSLPDALLPSPGLSEGVPAACPRSWRA